MKTLLIGGTHGNEPIGVRALETLEKKRSDFDWIIGNPKALAQNTRTFEGDLNRSAPGDLSSIIYEQRRAAEILSLTKQYDVTIDLHGTDQNTGLFMIVTNPTKANLQLASRIDLNRIVIWRSISPELAGPMSEFFPVGLEIECGLKDTIETQTELERVLDRYLNECERPLCDWEDRLCLKEIYEVYGSLRQESELLLKEFVETTVAGETFTPLLIGVYKQKTDVVCYKMRRVKTWSAVKAAF